MKRVISLIVIGVLLFSTVGIMAGCNKDVYVEGKEWNYYKLRRGKDGVALTRLKDESLIVDGVLTIPTKLGKYKVTALTGITKSDILGWSARTYFFGSGGAKHIIIPAGIEIRDFFWSEHTPLVIEFLAEAPEERSHFTIGISKWVSTPFPEHNGIRTIVVPDGSRDSYIERIIRCGEIQEALLRIIEKSEYINEINNGA